MKGYSKGVNFHTSANRDFGRNTKPANVMVTTYSRAMPKPRSAPVGAYAAGGAVCTPGGMKAASEAAVARHVVAPAPKGHKGLKK